MLKTRLVKIPLVPQPNKELYKAKQMPLIREWFTHTSMTVFDL